MDVSKAQFLSSKDGIQLFCPIAKFRKEADGTAWVEGWGSVCDYLDDQNDIVDPVGMREAVEDWAPWGNIRLQHDASKPIGVCPEGNWSFKKHPETGTDALYLNTHIVEPTAVKMLEEGVLKGFSIGGVCLEREPEMVKKEDGSEVRANRLKRIQLSEISLVDKPACDLATVEHVQLAKRSETLRVAGEPSATTQGSEKWTQDGSIGGAGGNACASSAGTEARSTDTEMGKTDSIEITSEGRGPLRKLFGFLFGRGDETNGPSAATATVLINKADDAETVRVAGEPPATTLGLVKGEPTDGGEKSKEPYGDIDYADPGYQEDGKKRYPIDTEEHIRAAWNYINKLKNADLYSGKQLKEIKARIIAAWKKKIDEDGPPSASEKTAGGRDDIAKSLGTVGYLTSKLQDWDWDIEAMTGCVASLQHEAVEEGDESDAPAKLRAVIEEFKQLRNKLGQVMVEIAEEEVGEIAEGTEAEEEIVMNAAKVLKAIQDAVGDNNRLDKAGKSISAANMAHLNKASHHLAKAAEHHEALGKCIGKMDKAADEGSGLRVELADHHEAMGEHLEMASHYLGKVMKAGDEHKGPDADRATPSGGIEDKTVEEMIAAALGIGDVKKGGNLFSEYISLVKKNAELEARLSVMDSTPQGASPGKRFSFRRLFVLVVPKRYLLRQSVGLRGGALCHAASRRCFTTGSGSS